MPVSAEISLNQLPALANQIGREVVQGDYTPALKKIAVAARADIQERFATATSPSGEKWPPIKGFRVRQGNGNFQPLRDRGLLAASATSQVAQGHVEEITSVSMEVGTNLDYAGTHQHGATILPKKAKALAIPWTLEALRAGSPRQFGLPLRLVWPKGNRAGWLVQDAPKKGKKGERSILHYFLIPKAVIPKREFIGWSPSLLEIADQILQERMQELAGGR